MPKPRKNSEPAKPGPARAGMRVPRPLCPFSGGPLQYVEVTTTAAGYPDKRWQVRGSGWVSTKLFHSKAEAEWFFSHDHGVPPAFPSPHARIEVVGERLPPDPAQAEAERAIRDAESVGYGMVEATKEIMP